MPSLSGFTGGLENYSLFLLYKGRLDEKILADIYTNIETEILKIDDEKQRKKRFFHVLVECIQNVFRHMDVSSEDVNEVCLAAGYNDKRNYAIRTGNYILKTDIPMLQKELDQINSLTESEMHESYLNKLSSGKLSPKGGAGLGLIDIARKSCSKLGYRFADHSATHSFFIFDVTVI